MQPVFNNLITQNEYFDYQRAIRNIINYNYYGLHSVTVDNGSLVHNPNYGFIQSIKDIFLAIFVKDYHLDEANHKRQILERDFKIINNIYGRYSGLVKKPASDRDELYKIFYTTLIASEFVNAERVYRYVLSEDKGVGGLIRRCVDYLTGYKLSPMIDRRIQWPDKNSINYFNALHRDPVFELVQFTLNTCENTEPFHVDYFLKQLHKEHSDARVVVHYCFAVSEYMRREDKQIVFDSEKQKALRELFVRHSLQAIEKNWSDETGKELLLKIASMVNLVPNPSDVRVKFGITLVTLKERNPHLTFNLQELLDLRPL